MDKTFNKILKTTLLVFLGSVVACGDDKPPASQSQVVSKKIKVAQSKPPVAKEATVHASGDKGSPTATPGNATPVAETATKTKTNDAASTSAAVPLEKATAVSGDNAAPVTSELIKASMELSSGYDPKGRIDPFEPLFSDEPESPVVRASTGKKKRRAPQTPLEKVAITQLKLTAILQMPQGNRALVEDATGKGYVVKKGTYMGLNAGQVIRIDKDRVLVEEEIQNMVGEYIINNTELKLQKTAGEL